ncbi:MAG: hypothetical protein IJ981_01150, partial [Clostridia bacterium]|nr:hypothetical protein [Clostridia bacterium]
MSIIDVRTEKKSVVSVALGKATIKSISYGRTVRYNRINLRESVIIQAIENVAILLKEMYPRMHEGLLPNLEDMLK